MKPKSQTNKQLDIEKILESNPDIDKDLFEAVQEQLKKLKAMGITKRTQYNLAIPFTRRASVRG